MDSTRELCGRFALTESSVKSILHRTRNKLREYLEKEGIFL
jgi:DNA-directed RNA polymerase specialized sigma24 family protein